MLLVMKWYVVASHAQFERYIYRSFQPAAALAIFTQVVNKESLHSV